jgi:hypothetical protein
MTKDLFGQDNSSEGDRVGRKHRFSPRPNRKKGKWGKRDSEEWKKCQREWMREWRKNNPDKAKEKARVASRKRWKENTVYRETTNRWRKEEYYPLVEKPKRLLRERQKRLRVINFYGGRCKCCGEDTFEFLAIDHINNDGAEHRRTFKSSIIDWIIKNNFPKGFQILCHNCNLAKAFYGECPHNKEKNIG